MSAFDPLQTSEWGAITGGMTTETTLRERLASGKPELVADLYLYSADKGGRTKPIGFGWGVPCATEQGAEEAWDGYPLLDRDMVPGEHRRVGFVFLSGSAAVNALGGSGRFYLIEDRVIGEAVITRS